MVGQDVWVVVDLVHGHDGHGGELGRGELAAGGDGEDAADVELGLLPLAPARELLVPAIRINVCFALL